MLRLIDTFLNKVTMYRLVLYYLVTLIIIAALYSFFGLLYFTPIELAFSTLVILTACWISNVVFAKVSGATPNVESVYITGFILALIVDPVAPVDAVGVGFIVFASVAAMASKYIFTIGKKHLFNPAAFGVALSALLLGHSASWWIGVSANLLPFVLIGGLLIVRKTCRFELVIAFSLVALLILTLTAPNSDLLTVIVQTFINTPFFFFALVMLTEPLTMPSGRYSIIVYGALVGVLLSSNIHLGAFYLSPELALLSGNIFAYVVSPKWRLMLTLIGKNKIADSTYEFVFVPDKPRAFLPGQYLEWTLGHRGSDARGSRRFFTIASSPTEKTMRLGVKFSASGSSFKRALWNMRPNDTLSASHLSGDFVLPKNVREKLVFIAGGIGVTPFRSMVQYLIDNKEDRNVVLLYSNKTAAEIAYKDVFDRAVWEIGMKTVYAMTNEPSPVSGTHAGAIDAELIAHEVPDLHERTFYISGPHGMVVAFEKTLKAMGVSRSRIKTDYFPGFT